MVKKVSKPPKEVSATFVASTSSKPKKVSKPKPVVEEEDDEEEEDFAAAMEEVDAGGMDDEEEEEVVVEAPKKVKAKEKVKVSIVSSQLTRREFFEVDLLPR